MSLYTIGLVRSIKGPKCSHHDTCLSKVDTEQLYTQNWILLRGQNEAKKRPGPKLTVLNIENVSRTQVTVLKI